MRSIVRWVAGKMGFRRRWFVVCQIGGDRLFQPTPCKSRDEARRVAARINRRFGAPIERAEQRWSWGKP